MKGRIKREGEGRLKMFAWDNGEENMSRTEVGETAGKLLHKLYKRGCSGLGVVNR
jgi:hypothetical protein